MLFKGPVIIVSSKGGVNIEQVAAESPQAISYFPVNINKGLSCEETMCIAEKLGVNKDDRQLVADVVCNLYELFIETDATMLEINPFAEDICGDCNYIAIFK